MNNNSRIPTLTKANILAYCILVIILLDVASIILFAFGKLPSLLVEGVGSIEVVIALIVTIREKRDSLKLPIWRYIKLFAIWVTICATILGLVFCGYLISLIHFGAGGSSSSNSSAPPAQYLAFQQPVPSCNNPSGTLWSTPFPGTLLACTKAGLLMRPVSTYHGAAVQLDQVNSQPYRLYDVSIQVKLIFQKPIDSLTQSGFVIQTNPDYPDADKQGFEFLLFPTGHWELWFIPSQSTQEEEVASGNVNINSKEPTAIGERIASGTLYSSINGQVVNMWSNQVIDNSFFEENGTASLVMGGGRNTISSVVYSNLSLMSLH